MAYQDLPSEFLEQFKDYDDHEGVRRIELPDNIVAFIGVHNTNLGPALGGCRIKNYAGEAEALEDVLRLSKGMTYKNALANLPLGGGKAVIMSDPFTQKTKEIMLAMGEAVQSMEGAYVTAEDSGTTEEDMAIMSTVTDYVTGLPPEMFKDSDYGELGGNPSPLTALGCYHGIQAAVAFHFDRKRAMHSITATVQGLGAVGLEICKLLHQDGVKLIGTDVNEDAIAQAKAAIPDITIVKPEEIYAVEADLFVPCAMGGILNDKTIPILNVGIVAGMANNQLAEPHHDKMLKQRDILYVPDYVINAGGVICVGYEFFRKSDYNPQDFVIDRDHMVEHVERIRHAVTYVLKAARDRGLPTGEAADRLAEERFLKGEPLDEFFDALEAEQNFNPEGSAMFASGGGTKLVQ